MERERERERENDEIEALYCMNERAKITGFPNVAFS